VRIPRRLRELRAMAGPNIALDLGLQILSRASTKCLLVGFGALGCGFAVWNQNRPTLSEQERKLSKSIGTLGVVSLAIGAILSLWSYLRNPPQVQHYSGYTLGTVIGAYLFGIVSGGLLKTKFSEKLNEDTELAQKKIQ